MRRSTVICLAIVSALALAFGHKASGQPAGGQGAAKAEGDAVGAEIKYDGRTIAEWIKEWDTNDFVKSQGAIRALAAAGRPAAEELNKLIKEQHRHSGNAFKALAQMGEPARGVLPTLLELAADKSAANPPGWTWNVSFRGLLLMEVKEMSWAADEWIPALQRIAADESDEEWNRLRAIEALGGMGVKAAPILKEFAANKNDEIRKSANYSLAEAGVAAGRSKAAIYEDIIDLNPLDANVPDYLIRMQGRYNNQSHNPVAQRVKAALRKQLAEKPDAEMALTLATIIQNGLANTDLEFAAPTDSYGAHYGREDSAENYSTLAEALEIGVAHAPRGSALANRLGQSLARLRLLQGDWDGMNAALAKIGQEPIPAEMRATLPAPPRDWSNLHKDWQPADIDLRSGTGAIEFEFEKDGKGIAGAHVLIKRRKPDDVGRRTTGLRADTLLLMPQPLDTTSIGGFGYRAADRGQTRYAVSDASGKIRFEGLPAVPIAVEALIPTSNFPEASRKWDLLMETAPGEIRRTWIEASSTRGSRPSIREVPRTDGRPQLQQVSRTEGPALVELKAGETVKYPKFIVRPQLLLNVAEWASVDASEFVLWWSDASREKDLDHYEVEMMLTAPQQRPSYLPSQRNILSTKVDTTATHWAVGEQGIGGQRLRPGNIYMFEVRAVDRDGKVLARLPATRVFVPWTHRKSPPPDKDSDSIRGVPIYDGVGWRDGSTVLGQPRVDVGEKVAKYLAAGNTGFELEYVQLGNAWLQCLNGKADEGRKEMERLVQALPEGNVVRGTARAMLQQLDAGQELAKRLQFVADE